MCSGSRSIPLHFGSCNFDWLFQLALVLIPRLVTDFLCHHNLLIFISPCISPLHFQVCLGPAPRVPRHFLLCWVYSFSTPPSSTPPFSHPSWPVSFSLNPAAWILTNWQLPKLSYLPLRRRASSAGLPPPAPGLLLFTWSRRKRAVGGLVAIIGSLTLLQFQILILSSSPKHPEFHLED